MRLRNYGLVYSADGGAGEGGAGGTGSGGSGSQISGNDPNEALRGLLARHNNDATAALGIVLSENFRERERRRAAEAQIPAEGSVVLTREQGAQWAAYQTLGAPDALTTAIKDRDTASTELATLRRASTLRDVADVSKYEPSVLQTLAGDLQFEVREVEANGVRERRAFVKAGDTTTPLADYAQQHWAKFLPALQPTADKPGTELPDQRRAAGSEGGADPIGDALKGFQAQRDSQPNALAPKK